MRAPDSAYVSVVYEHERECTMASILHEQAPILVMILRMVPRTKLQGVVGPKVEQG